MDYVSTLAKERHIFNFFFTGLVIAWERGICNLSKNFSLASWKPYFFIADSWTILLIKWDRTLSLDSSKPFGFGEAPKLLRNRFIHARFNYFLSALQSKHVLFIQELSTSYNYLFNRSQGRGWRRIILKVYHLLLSSNINLSPHASYVQLITVYTQTLELFTTDGFL